jgi:hypothetical protein
MFRDAEDGTCYARLGSAVEARNLETALREHRVNYATSIRKHKRGTREFVVTVFPTRSTPLPAHGAT